jgi:hypothetical protein
VADARNTIWHQTDQINMSVQMADISLDGFTAARALKINCNLKNIARGQCAVTIRPDDDEHDDDGHDDDGHDDDGKADAPDASKGESQAGGQLHIFVDRPLMTADLTVSNRYFDRLTSYMSKASNRPMELVLTLKEALAVSIDGDLSIDSETIITITSISVNIPVK